MTDNTHAPLAPSSAARTMQCTGWIKLSKDAPPDNSDPEASEEGTLAHECAAALLRGDDVRAYTDADMLEGAAVYVAAIESLRRRHPEATDVHIEQRVNCAHIHPSNWGTPDATLFNRARMRLDVFDYKYGHGYVEVFENWQLLNYASGRVEELGLSNYDDLSVNLHIVQPRSYHRDGPVRSWSLTGRALREYTERMRIVFSAAMHPTDPICCNTGSECRYCPSRGPHCPALLGVGYDTIDRYMHSLPLNMTPQDMGVVLKQIRMAQERLNAIESGLTQQVEATIRNGGRVPGFHLEPTSGRMEWTDSVAEVITIGDLMGIDIRKEPKCMTPTQAIKAGIPADVVEKFAKRSRVVKLEEDGVSMRKIFGGVR